MEGSIMFQQIDWTNLEHPRLFINGDCMEYMKTMPDNYVDLALVDPPYGIGENKGQCNSRNINRIDKRTGRPIIIKHQGYKPKKWDEKPVSKEIISEIIRVSKNQILWGANHYIENINKNSSCWIVWDKCNGESDFADCELAWTSFKSAVRIFRFMWSGFCQGKSMKEGYINQGNKRLCETRIHPTQKPVKLYEWLLTHYAKPGDKILDTHVGSASSLIACHNYGFDYIGFEIDKDYYEAAKRRLEAVKAQVSMFV
jgi:site-specific DNA-methyltransferase (adenine-specific)